MFLLGYPYGFAMIVSSILYLIIGRVDITNVVDVMVIQFENNFVLLAVPLFIFSAKVFNSLQAHRPPVRLRQRAWWARPAAAWRT